MSQIRLYLDEDTINKALIRALHNAELDVITVVDASRLGLPDEKQLLWATEQRRVIYSYNIGDFCCLHRDLHIGGNCSRRDHSCLAARLLDRAAVARVTEAGV